MKTEIYGIPEEIKVPEINFMNFNLKQYNEDVEKFKKELIQFLNEQGYYSKYTGEIVQFPVADSYAEYMVASLHPLRLIHLPLGDAWEYEYIQRLTKADILQKIEQQNALKAMFERNKKQ